MTLLIKRLTDPPKITGALTVPETMSVPAVSAVSSQPAAHN